MTALILLTTGDEVSTGCWCDSHHGQYVPDHLADGVDDIIDIEPLDDPRIIRQFADALADCGPTSARAAEVMWEWHSEATDKMIDRLNDVTPDGWAWGWWEGEIHLQPRCWWRAEGLGADADDDDASPDPECAHCTEE